MMLISGTVIHFLIDSLIALLSYYQNTVLFLKNELLISGIQYKNLISHLPNELNFNVHDIAFSTSDSLSLPGPRVSPSKLFTL